MMLKVTLCPVPSVRGKDRPCVENVALVDCCEIVMLLLSLLVKVTSAVVVFPVCTLPNGRLGGLAINDCCDSPQPLSFRVAAPPLNWMVPLAGPVTVGTNPTVKLTLCPATKVNGSLNPVALYGTPFTVIVDKVMLVEPVLVTVGDSIAVCPTITSPKRKAGGLKLSCLAAADACRRGRKAPITKKNESFES